MPDAMIFAIKRQYAGSSKRLFLLDYDGTLRSFVNVPSRARPTKAILAALKGLTDDPANTVVIISGRDHETLDRWLGGLPVALVAEHGFFRKEPHGAWAYTQLKLPSWKQPVASLLALGVASVPGSFIEEKTTSLVWHYRAAVDRVDAERVAKDVMRHLEGPAQSLGLLVVPGQSIVEVRVGWMTKGDAAGQWLHRQPWDFILAAGDDTTDEDMFRVVPDAACTIKVGTGPSLAHSRVHSPDAFVQLLARLP